jgi:hypothetical protein
MSYSSYSPSTPSTPTSTSCKYKKALLRGFRPSPQNQKTQCGVCPDRCIYCDIWKLATLIYSHVPAGVKSHSHHSSPSSSSSHLSRSSSSASSSSSSDDDDEMSTKAIQAAFQAQRARLASILSICTVDGADECEGLQLAHDRCLMSVTDLMDKEKMLQERAASAARQRYEVQMDSADRHNSSRRISRDCGSRSGSLRERYISESRRSSIVGMAR